MSEVEHVKIESDFYHSAIRCVVVGLSKGYRCGYCEIPKGHPWWGKHYSDISVNVHGSLTYSDDSSADFPLCPDTEDAWWIGFDCGQHWDGLDPTLVPDDEESQMVFKSLSQYRNGGIKTKEFVEEELKKVASAAGKLSRGSEFGKVLGEAYHNLSTEQFVNVLFNLSEEKS